MASFSRLQLAAALLEYDNDPDNPNAPKRSAYESAIFAHLRSANGNIHAKKPDTNKNNDYLGVSLPSEAGGASDSHSGVYKDTTRRSKGSIDMLHNPFGKEEEADVAEEEGADEEDMEVDLASWGLDSLIPDKKESKLSKGKGKAKSEILGNNGRNASTGLSHSRSASMPLAGLGQSGGSIQDLQPDFRRNSLSNPLDLVDERPHNKAPIRQRTLSLDKLATHPPFQAIPLSERREDTVPFPSSPILSGNKEAPAFSSSRPASHLGDLPAAQENEANPFVIPPPPPSRASRFDPKSVAHVRTLSNATRLSTAPQGGLMPRAPSALDVGQLRERRQSTATMRTRDMLDDDFQSSYGYDDRQFPARERRYSRLDLMRPKVLVMPSPLQGATPAPPEHTKPTREGFLDSSDGRPLPPGARASRASVLEVPVPVNSFTPNPRLSLSSSQLLFRNNLLVDGQRDVTYNDIDGDIQRAVEEGEQVIMPEPKEESPKAKPAPLPAPDTQDVRQKRPAGKLFGRSLIDDLEARKAEMRGKQRVFTGDQRPSMMDRPGIIRSSTLIDPSAFGDRPALGVRNEPVHTDTTLVRRGSRNSKPLLAIDDAGKIAETGIRESRIAQTRSVFGVDTLWAREVEKLKIIEAEEKAAAEERRIQEEKEEARRAKKSKGKNKGKRKDARDKLEASEEKVMQHQSPVTPQDSSTMTSSRKQDEVSITLPDIPVVTSRRRVDRAPIDDGSDYESSASASEIGVRTGGSRLADDLADQWVSDDEKKIVQPSSSKDISPAPILAGDDSDEDLPLSVTLERATRNLSLRKNGVDEDSDEDKPLSSLLIDRPKIDIPSIDFDNLGPKEEEEEDDEDDVPLGVRVSRLPAGASQLSALSSLSAGDDDDRPLSMHPGQIRKSQFNLFAQMQQQQQIQQQQLLQAQLAQSMAFSAQQPSMMFMVPPAAPYTSQPNLPAQDNKFTSVDRWRHGVAVEGSSN